MRTILALLCVTVVGAAAPAAAPPAVHISPTTIAIAHGETAGSFTIRNEAREPVVFTASAFGWRNSASGEMQLDPTEDVVVFPTRITINAGETRRVRLGARVAAGAIERAYRVVLEQIATPGTANGIEMRMKFNMPVFLQPQKRVASVDLHTVDLANSRVRVGVANVSGLHVTPKQLSVTGKDASGATIWTKTLQPWYLLAGERREQSVELTASECARTSSVDAEVTFLEGDGLTVRKRAAAGARACSAR